MSETGYYKHIRNIGKPPKDEYLTAQIRKIHSESEYNDNYGVNRMQLALKQKGIKAGKGKIRKIMQKLQMLHKRVRRPLGLTKATIEEQERENLLKQDFKAAEPLKKLLTDISQIPCEDGRLYISPILDCFDGSVLALEMRDNMKKELCIDTFRTVKRRYNLKGCILHSDRGCQYTSKEFKKELDDAGVVQSLSGTDRCYDNARMESFFATLKKELLYRIPTYKMKMATVKSIIFRYVFTYYNRKRVYTSNPDGLPPEFYRALFENMGMVA